MTPEQQAQYARAYGSRDDLKSDEARAAYDRLDAAPRPFVLPPPPQPKLRAAPPPGKARVAVVRGRLAVAAVVLLLGVIAQSVTSSHAAVCNSGIGQFAQSLSTSAYADCSLWTGVHAFGEFLFWLGLVGVVGLGIMLALAAQRSDPGVG